MSFEAFDIVSQGEELESCGKSSGDLWGLGGCACCASDRRSENKVRKKSAKRCLLKEGVLILFRLRFLTFFVNEEDLESCVFFLE